MNVRCLLSVGAIVAAGWSAGIAEAASVTITGSDNRFFTAIVIDGGSAVVDEIEPAFPSAGTMDVDDPINQPGSVARLTYDLRQTEGGATFDITTEAVAGGVAGADASVDSLLQFTIEEDTAYSFTAFGPEISGLGMFQATLAEQGEHEDEDNLLEIQALVSNEPDGGVGVVGYTSTPGPGGVTYNTFTREGTLIAGDYRLFVRASTYRSDSNFLGSARLVLGDGDGGTPVIPTPGAAAAGLAMLAGLVAKRRRSA